MPLPAGVEKENALRAAGFNDSEVGEWKTQTQNDLLNAGFSTPEIGDYFGEKNPDMKPIKDVFAANKAKAEAEINPNPEAGPRKAETFEDAIEAGWQMSVSGLIKRGAKPDVLLPEDAPMFYRIASQVSGLAGDIPAMLSGGAIAGAAAAPVAAVTGPAAPVVEAAAAGYGAFALPAAIREVLMQHYEKGDVKDFNDFWERSAATFIEANKQGMIGAATAGVGGVVAKGAIGVGASAAVKTTAQLTSEVATMVTVGKAIEGQVPQPQDFIDAAVLVGGLHGVLKAAPKLREVYSKGNVQPAEIAQQAMTNPLVKQDLLAEGPKGVVPENIAKANGIPIASKEPIGPMAGSKEGVGSSQPKPQEPIAPARSEAANKVLEQIGEKATPEKPGYTLNEGYKDFVDQLDPIKQALKKLNVDPDSLKADENPYQLARMANDYKAKAKYVLEKGTLDFKTLAKTGESFDAIFKEIKKDPQGFDIYLAAKRAIEVEGKNKTSGFDLKAAEQVVKEGKKQYEETAQRLYEFKNKNLEYLRDSGVLSKDEFKNMVELNKSHVSFSRILEAEKGAPGPGARKLGMLKEFKGSELKIQSPLLSTLENTTAILKVAERNRASLALVDKVLEFKDQGLLKKSEARGQLRDDQFEVWRNGEREIYETTKEAPVGLAEAIKSLDGDVPSSNLAMRLAAGITGIKKFSITIMPEFIIKNVFRDQLTMGAFSKNSARPFLDIIPAMGNIIKKDEVYYNWLKSGGAQGTFVDMSTNYLQKRIFELDSKTGFIGSTWNVLKKPVDFLQAAGMLAEHASRLAEFKRATKGATEGTKIFEGGFASREVTLDFSRTGAKLSALNGITAFQNMSIQGLDKTIRAIKADPAGVGIKAVTYITVPSILLWYANKDDRRYQDLPRWQKDLFWIVPTDRWEKTDQQFDDDQLKANKGLYRKASDGTFEINNGPIFRIPKPQELGILFGSMPERTLEKFFTDNPKAMDDFDETVWQLATPAFVPDAVAPVTEQWANKSLFTGNKIVGGAVEKVLPAYQYNEYTTESAKIIGKMVRTLPAAVTGKSDTLVDLPVSSPAVIENYVRSWSGNLGMYVLQTADVALAKSGVTPDPVKPKDTLADIPFIKAFVVRYPSGSAQPIEDFYNEFGKHEKVANTIAHLAKTGDFTNLEKELQDPQVQDMLVKLKGINDALRTQAQVARRVYKNPGFSSDDQRQMLDGIYYGMIETARMGNELMLTLDKIQKSEGSQ